MRREMPSSFGHDRNLEPMRFTDGPEAFESPSGEGVVLVAGDDSDGLECPSVLLLVDVSDKRHVRTGDLSSKAPRLWTEGD